MQWNDWLAVAIFLALITGQLYYWAGRFFLGLVNAWMNRK